MVRHQGRAVDEAVLPFRLLLSHGCAEEKKHRHIFLRYHFPGTSGRLLPSCGQIAEHRGMENSNRQGTGRPGQNGFVFFLHMFSEDLLGYFLKGSFVSIKKRKRTKGRQERNNNTNPRNNLPENGSVRLSHVHGACPYPTAIPPSTVRRANNGIRIN